MAAFKTLHVETPLLNNTDVSDCTLEPIKKRDKIETTLYNEPFTFKSD